MDTRNPRSHSNGGTSLRVHRGGAKGFMGFCGRTASCQCVYTGSIHLGTAAKTAGTSARKDALTFERKRADFGIVAPAALHSGICLEVSRFHIFNNLVNLFFLFIQLLLCSCGRNFFPRFNKIVT